MLKFIFTLLLGIGGILQVSFAQNLPPVTEGLIAFYSFDDCDNLVKDDTGGGSDGVISGNPKCACGVSGNAIELDGINDFVIFPGAVNNFFDVDNISISFYFKSFNNPLHQTILTKRDACTPNHALDISYTPTQNSVTAYLGENSSKENSTKGTLSFTECWHHVVMVRRGGRTILYLDGELVNETSAISRIDLENNGVLTLAGGPCIGSGTNRFKGYIDELAIYSDDLIVPRPKELYLRPDDVTTENQTLFLGESVDVNSNSTCATSYNWNPSDNVDNPSTDSTTISPTESMTYQLQMIDVNGCIATDTVRFTVIDPSTLNCKEIYLPKAFSPNGKGPIANETFGISNYRTVKNLSSFEIFDRWGSCVFRTENAEEKWDGTLSGSPVDAGVYLYKIKFECEGETQQKFGSVVLMR